MGSIHFLPFPTANLSAVDERMELKVKRMQTLIERGRNARDKRGISLRMPIKGLTVICPNKELIADIEKRIIVQTLERRWTQWPLLRLRRMLAHNRQCVGTGGGREAAYMATTANSVILRMKPSRRGRGAHTVSRPITQAALVSLGVGLWTLSASSCYVVAGC